jgi:hypothetical protein
MEPLIVSDESPTSLESPTGAIPLGTTTWSIIQGLKDILKRSDWFREYTNFYFDKQRSQKYPYAMIILDEENMEEMISGRKMEAILTVWFVRANAQKTEMEKAYSEIERFWELLQLHPRLDNLDMIDSIGIVKAKVLYGEGTEYFETIVEIKVKVKLHRRT